MEKDEEIDDELFKPSRVLYVFLFILYAVWIWNIFGYLKYCFVFGFDEYKSLDTFGWGSGALVLIISVVAFYSIIKTLRGDNDCITSLKWAIIYGLIYSLIDPTRVQVPSYNLGIRLTVYAIKPAFYLAFYLYLCFSKSIKTRYPKQERRFGKSGWGWIGLTAALLGMGVWEGLKEHNINQYCKPVDIEQLKLYPGEQTDGIVIFKDNGQWEKWEADSLSIEYDDIILFPSLHSEDSTRQIFLLTGRCDKLTERLHNSIIVQALGRIKHPLTETAHLDSIINGNQVYATCFQALSDSISSSYTVLSISEGENAKGAVFMISEAQDNGLKAAQSLAESIIFNLSNRLPKKTVNKESSNDHKDEVSERIKNGNNNPRANLFSRTDKSLTPCQPLCIMLLKHNEREKTQDKQNYISY